MHPESGQDASHQAHTRPDVDAPPDTGGAYDDIRLVAPDADWAKDDQGYPGGEDNPDPDRLPESDGMAEDPVEPETAEPATAATPAARTPAKLVPEGIWDDVGAHLDELRKRLIISLSVFVPLFGLGIWLYRDLWRIIIMPLDRAAPHLLRFQALNPSDGLVMAMRIAFAFAVFLSLPVWLSQVWCFVSPGLTGREKRNVYLALGSGGLLFCVGAAAAYFIGVPYALEYLLPFNMSLLGWENAFTGSGYVEFVITCCAGFGLAFELPLVMLALAWAGILTTAFLREWWRVVILGIFILAAIMTPPDPFTQLLLALPMLGLFLVGYLLVRWVEPKS